MKKAVVRLIYQNKYDENRREPSHIVSYVSEQGLFVNLKLYICYVNPFIL